jgi:hypothetical protein
MTWSQALAIGYVLRLLLVIVVMPQLDIPMLVFVVVLHILIAFGVLLERRLVLAFAVYGAATGIAGFLYASMFPNPMGWYALGFASVALTIVGVLAWRSKPWLGRAD